MGEKPKNTRPVVRRRGMALLTCSMLLASCGARWSDDQQAALQGRYTSQVALANTASTGAASTESAATQSAASGVSATDRTGIQSADIAGSDEVAVQPADRTAATALPCSAPSNAPGVTDDMVSVANLATVTGPIPGLAETSREAARAYVAFLNASGGVCGRRVEIRTVDDGTDGARARQLIKDLGPQVLGFVGIFSPVSGAAAPLVEDQRLPVTGTASGPEIRAVSTFFDINPIPPVGVVDKFDYLISQGVRTASVVTLAADAAIQELNEHQAQMEAAGIEVVNRQLLPLTTLSYDSAARSVANSKADYLFFLGTGSMDAGMARSMRDTGYELKFEEYLTGYGSNFTELAGAAADGTSSWIRSLPVEETGSNPALDTFLQWMATTSPGTPTDVFAVDAWAATKAFFDALEQLPGPITRASLVEQIRTFTDYDADGMIGRINFADGISNGCLIGMRFTGGSWRRIAPSTGFLC